LPCAILVFVFFGVMRVHTAVTRKSEQLVFESRLYEKRSQWLNTKLFWRKWAPAIIVAVLVLVVVYLRFFWFY
jgi:anti-sigma-K factor RskA